MDGHGSHGQAVQHHRVGIGVAGAKRLGHGGGTVGFDDGHTAAVIIHHCGSHIIDMNRLVVGIR